ncbi:hypothetical protein N865_14215 [Intrasporangium oryzae NRRL B-24470]|uniref:YdbS-like PH domain-containing protein n=1 Tax=Intrasporangium oryzae NRRL B-24470 TaxID=1386089 RepID=W9G5T2_9MICO|nr:PH domain-containing protein [Intrasporangium oryzae]EWT00672.1 hypothetical protein N865_14215 [Intrasporangium oryzae NRRL B-24470]
MAIRRDDVPAGLQSVLLPGETIVAANHSHPAKIAKDVGITILAFIVALFIDSNVTSKSQMLGTLFWWVFFIMLVRMLWILLEWRHDWFVATDKRLILRYGLITHKVAMMPLLKVTDMSYERSITGQFLGFGRFILESAGQDQALRTINFVPHPDETYRAICAEIFHIVPPAPEPEFEGEEGEEGFGGPDDFGGPGGSGGPGGHGGDDGTPFAPFGSQPGYPDVNPIHTPVQDRLDSYSRALPVHRPVAEPVHRPVSEPVHRPAVEPTRDGESLYSSEDIRRRRRGADTGPIWPVGGPPPEPTSSEG